MDELKMKLSTRLMRGVLAQLISKAVSKKFGCDVDIRFHEIEATMEGGKLRIHANVDAEMDNKDFVKIVKSTGLE